MDRVHKSPKKGSDSVLLGGLASNNKYALLGGLRSAAQMVSYEVFMGLSLMGVVMLTGSFSMRAIVEAQPGDDVVLQLERPTRLDLAVTDPDGTCPVVG